MQRSVLKLAALAGVVSLGFFLVLQTQFSLTRPAEEVVSRQGKKPAKSGTVTSGNHRSPAAVFRGQSEPHNTAGTPSFGGSAAVKPTGNRAVQQAKQEENPHPFAASATLTGAKVSRSQPTPPPNFEQTPVLRTGGIASGSSASSPPSASKFGKPDVGGPKFADNRQGNAEAKKQRSPFAPKPVEAPAKSDRSTSPFYKSMDPAGQSRSAQPAVTEQKTPAANTGGNPFGSADGPNFSEKVTFAEKPKSSVKPKEHLPEKPIPHTESPFSLDEEPSKEINPTTKQTQETPPSTVSSPTLPDKGGVKTARRKSSPMSTVPEKTAPFLLDRDDRDKATNAKDAAAKDGAAKKKTPSTVPKRLSPSPQANKLAPKIDQTYHGDGTAGAGTPRGLQQSRLTIEKVAPKNAVLGKPFVYDIVIKNLGKIPAYRVVLEDRIPKGAKLMGTAPQAVLTGKTLRWKLGKIPPGSQQKISVRIIPLTTGQIGSVATVNFVSEVAAETTISAPNLQLELTGPKQAKLGTLVSFRFKVTNSGNGDAQDVWIRDIIPAGFKHPAGSDLEYKVGTLKAGAVKQITLKMTVVKSGTLINRGVVTASGGIRIEAAASVKIVSSRLVISRSGPKRRYLGRVAVYTNLVTNDSSQPIQGATLTEVIPAGMEFSAATSGGQYDPARRLVAWNVGSLGPKQSRTFQLKLIPKKTGAQQSLVRVTTKEGTVTQTKSETTIDGFSSIGLEVETRNRPVDVGEQVVFRITARNRGTAAATNIRIRLKIPPSLEWVGTRGGAKFTRTGNEIVFHPVASISAGAKAGFDVVLKARSKGDVRFSVQIQSDQMSRPLNREEAVLIIPATQ